MYVRFNDDDDSFTKQTDKMMMVIHLLNKQISLMTDSLIKSHNLLGKQKIKCRRRWVMRLVVMRRVVRRVMRMVMFKKNEKKYKRIGKF